MRAFLANGLLAGWKDSILREMRSFPARPSDRWPAQARAPDQGLRGERLPLVVLVKHVAALRAELGRLGLVLWHPAALVAAVARPLLGLVPARCSRLDLALRRRPNHTCRPRRARGPKWVVGTREKVRGPPTSHLRRHIAHPHRRRRARGPKWVAARGSQVRGPPTSHLRWQSSHPLRIRDGNPATHFALLVTGRSVYSRELRLRYASRRWVYDAPWTRKAIVKPAVMAVSRTR